MEFFLSQNELTPKRLAFFASRQDPSRARQPRQAEQERQPAPQTPEQQPDRTMEHLSDSIRERIADLKAEELLSEKEQNDSPQEIVSRLKELSKTSDAKIFEWYGAKYDLTGAVTQQMKDDIRTKEIIRFKELVGTNAAKEVDAIIAGSPRPEAYAEALDRLKYRIGDIDTYSTTSVINKLEEDTKKLAKEEAIEKAKQEGKSEEEQKEAGEAAETNAKVGYESMQYVELLRKKTELEQKLKEERSKVAGIDEEIKAHKEAEATIDEKKEQYIDKKRSWLLKGLKAVGYASLAGGWLGAMSGLTGVGVGIISGLTGVTDIGFFKGLGIGATWLFNVAYKEMALLERFYGIGKVSQLMVAALTLVPLDFLWKKNLKNKSQKEYDQKKEALEKKKADQLDELKIKQMESEMSEAKLGLEKYKKLNQERVKLLQGQKKHYEKIQDDLMKQIDTNRKKGEAIGGLQTKLDLVSKTVLSLESFLTLFSVSEGDRAERVLGLSVVSPENILANIQAMEDKLEPQLSQNLLQLAQREETRLVREQKEVKEIVKRETLKDEINNLSPVNRHAVRLFFMNISNRNDDQLKSDAIREFANELEQNFPRTAQLIKILLHLPKTRFRKELANTVLNIMDMPKKEDEKDGNQDGNQDENQDVKPPEKPVGIPPEKDKKSTEAGKATPGVESPSQPSETSESDDGAAEKKSIQELMERGARNK